MLRSVLFLLLSTSLVFASGAKPVWELISGIALNSGAAKLVKGSLSDIPKELDEVAIDEFVVNIKLALKGLNNGQKPKTQADVERILKQIELPVEADASGKIDPRDLVKIMNTLVIKADESSDLRNLGALRTPYCGNPGLKKLGATVAVKTLPIDAGERVKELAKKVSPDQLDQAITKSLKDASVSTKNLDQTLREMDQATKAEALQVLDLLANPNKYGKKFLKRQTKANEFFDSLKRFSALEGDTIFSSRLHTYLLDPDADLASFTAQMDSISKKYDADDIITMAKEGKFNQIDPALQQNPGKANRAHAMMLEFEQVADANPQMRGYYDQMKELGCII